MIINTPPRVGQKRLRQEPLPFPSSKKSQLEKMKEIKEEIKEEMEEEMEEEIDVIGIMDADIGMDKINETETAKKARMMTEKTEKKTMCWNDRISNLTRSIVYGGNISNNQKICGDNVQLLPISLFNQFSSSNSNSPLSLHIKNLPSVKSARAISFEEDDFFDSKVLKLCMSMDSFTALFGIFNNCSCSICMDDFIPISNLEILSCCKNVFCRSCLKKWDKKTCPTCRKPY
jgi:hypothetical protein